MAFTGINMDATKINSDLINISATLIYLLHATYHSLDWDKAATQHNKHWHLSHHLTGTRLLHNIINTGTSEVNVMQENSSLLNLA